MKTYLPTYDEAQQMVDVNGTMVFYETYRFIDGFKVSTFNYRYPTFANFIKPLENSVANAGELRGLTFVFNEDGSLFKRYLLMKKFWNINQVPESLYDTIKNYKQISAYNKEDGSLISFIKLPNGKVIAKTKMGFDNYQTEEAERIYYSNTKIKDFVNKCLANEIVSMWEFVSFKNRIVINYDKPNLILIKMRDNNTGQYLDLEDYRNDDFDVVNQENITVDDAIKLSYTLTNKEGWVFTLEKSNGEQLMVKQKTQDYFDRHNLLTNEMNREDYVIKAILNNEIDDILSQLTENDTDKKEFINNIESVIVDFLNEREAELINLIDKYNGDKKDFALRYKKDKNFGLSMIVINGKLTVQETCISFLLKNTKKLQDAQSFIKRKGFKRK